MIFAISLKQTEFRWCGIEFTKWHVHFDIYCSKSSLTELRLKIYIHRYNIFMWIRVVIIISDQAQALADLISNFRFQPIFYLIIMFSQLVQIQWDKIEGICVEMSMPFREFYVTSPKLRLLQTDRKYHLLTFFFYMNRCRFKMSIYCFKFCSIWKIFWIVWIFFFFNIYNIYKHIGVGSDIIFGKVCNWVHDSH